MLVDKFRLKIVTEITCFSVREDEFNRAFDDIHLQLQNILKFNPEIGLMKTIVSLALKIIDEKIEFARKTMQDLVNTKTDEKTYQKKLKECMRKVSAFETTAEIPSLNEKLKSVRSSAEKKFEEIQKRFEDNANFVPCTPKIKNKLHRLKEKLDPKLWHQHKLVDILEYIFLKGCSDDAGKEAEKKVCKIHDLIHQ